MLKIQCEECGELFYKQPKEVARCKHHFCSKQCYNVYRKKHRCYTQQVKKSPELAKIEYLARLREEMINGKTKLR